MLKNKMLCGIMNRLILSFLVLTFFLAIYNWYEEQHFHGFFLASFGAVFGAAISIFSYWLVERKQWLPSFPFKVGALATTALSFFIYLYYAANGKAENSSSSSAQMHILLVPILLIFVAIITLFLSSVFSVVQKLLKSRRHNKA